MPANNYHKKLLKVHSTKLINQIEIKFTGWKATFALDHQFLISYLRYVFCIKINLPW